jgi:hypothetical protein
MGAVFQLVQCNGSGNKGSISDTPDAQRVTWECRAPSGSSPDYLNQIGCQSDYDVLATEPLDSSIPGAMSVKTLVDQADSNNVYFQNSKKYQIHWDFAHASLSGDGKPVVPDELSEFNKTEYYSSGRRFLLGAIKYYEGPKVWAYEIAPYDNSSAEMVEKAYRAIAKSGYFGQTLSFHSTSEAVRTEAEKLPASVPVVSTEQLYAATGYQALNLGASVGRLRFIAADRLQSETVDSRDIVVLDKAPSDISWVAALITEEAQTFLSPINLLSQNRGTPYMSLKGAQKNEKLRSLDGQWVRLEVGALKYSVDAVSQAEAEGFWGQHKPSSVKLPAADQSVTELKDADKIVDSALPLEKALQAAVAAFGSTASHYGALSQVKDVTVRKAFAIPVFYYFQFMRQNGFDKKVDQLLADETFRSNSALRNTRLQELRDAMKSAPVDADFDKRLLDKLNDQYSGVRVNFRSSSNAEALQGFPGACLAASESGDPKDSSKSISDAVRSVWSSVWAFRAFEERNARGIDHKSVGMALLVHQLFQNAAANGLAFTANPYNLSGLEPAFYCNVQLGDSSAFMPEPGVTTDQFIYYYYYTGQPSAFVSYSSLTSGAQTVLTRVQTHNLGIALDAIHSYFAKAYGPSSGQQRAWYAMNVEFAWVAEAGQEPILYIKGALPGAGRTQ